jgi:hypothetical protein
MHGRFDRPDKNDSRVAKDIGIGFLVLPIFVAIVLVTLMIIQPNTPTWIAEAVQAEFVGDTPSEPSPTQFAQPAAGPRSMTSGWISRVQTAWRGQR